MVTGLAYIFERLKRVLEEEAFRMENKVAGRYDYSSLRAYESGIAIIESKLPVEIGDLVGICRESGKVDPIGFVVDSKLNKYVINTITEERIPSIFGMSKAEFLYSIRERIKILDRADSIISRFSSAEKAEYIFLDESQLNLSLDEYEREAVEASLSLNDDEILLVMGPPGTGKTQFITEAARILAKKSGSLLLRKFIKPSTTCLSGCHPSTTPSG